MCRPMRAGVGLGAARRLVDDAAVRHHDDAVGQLQDLVEVLADQQHRRAGVAGRHDPGADLGDGGEVEAEAGIGHDEEVDRVGELARQHGPLHVAAGQRGDRRLGGGGLHPEPRDQILAAPAHGAGVEPDGRPGLDASRRLAAPVEGAEGQVLGHRHARRAGVAQRLLRDEAHSLRPALRRGVRHRPRPRPCTRPPVARIWPPSTSASSFWPLPETPAMPTISRACTARPSTAMWRRPDGVGGAHALDAQDHAVRVGPRRRGRRATRTGRAPIIIAAMSSRMSSPTVPPPDEACRGAARSRCGRRPRPRGTCG